MFKVGDKVIVIDSNVGEYQYNIGTILTIIYDMYDIDSKCSRYFLEHELRLYGE